MSCAECKTVLHEGQDREVTDDGVFCRPCFNTLTAELRRALDAQGTDINYPAALFGGVRPCGQYLLGDERGP